MFLSAFIFARNPCFSFRKSYFTVFADVAFAEELFAFLTALVFFAPQADVAFALFVVAFAPQADVPDIFALEVAAVALDVVAFAVEREVVAFAPVVLLF